MPPSIKNPPPPPSPSATVNPRKLVLSAIPSGAGHRVLLYGPGGIGKTTLACKAPGPVVFYDLDESLTRLKDRLQEPPMIVKCATWMDLRQSLQADGWNGVKTIVIDSATRAEELCIAHTLNTVPHEKGNKVFRLEDYGYGKGYQFVFEVYQTLLGDFEPHIRAGRNVFLLAHDCSAMVPNPTGEDWLRYEPRLQSPTSGKASIRLRTKEWSDHTLFMGYDVAVDKDGKGQGSGTRTLWTCELPHCMAKSRTTQSTFPVDDSFDWAEILT